ncbi:MAG: hypothetical protein IPH18_02230 [Chitinophagaceae bacterium]|nr:hypothetical protein [Chitinophagaceae bacterium]
MDYSKRKNDWEDKFFKHLDEKHPNLVDYFNGKILFPKYENWKLSMLDIQSQIQRGR